MTIEPKLMSAEELSRSRERHDGWTATEASDQQLADAITAVHEVKP